MLAREVRHRCAVVGLFGRSGAGKTSLVNAMAGVTTPRRGHIRVDDVSAVRQHTPHRRAPAASAGRLCLPGCIALPASVGAGEPPLWIALRAPAELATSRRSASSTCSVRRVASHARHVVRRRAAARRHRPRVAGAAAHSAAWTSRWRRSTCRARRRSSTMSNACATSSAYRSSMSAIRSRNHTPGGHGRHPLRGRMPGGRVTSTKSWAGSTSSRTPAAMKPAPSSKPSLRPRSGVSPSPTLRFPGGELTVPQVEAQVGERVRARSARGMYRSRPRPAGSASSTC